MVEDLGIICTCYDSKGFIHLQPLSLSSLVQHGWRDNVARARAPQHYLGEWVKGGGGEAISKKAKTKTSANQRNPILCNEKICYRILP